MPEAVCTSYQTWRSITDVVDGYFPIFFATVVVLFLIAVFWMTSKAASKGTLKKKNVDGLSMEEVRPLGPAYVWVFRIVIFTAIVALAYPILSPTLCENYTCKSSVWFPDRPDLFSECRAVTTLPE
jgi:uncharacterized membrane protein